MSFGRKTYDGSFLGRDPRTSEWGDSYPSKGEITKHASTKRTKRNARRIIEESSSVEEESGHDRYLITYADLITLLLGLFIILYSISKVDAKKYESIMSAMEGLFGHGGKVVAVSSDLVNTHNLPVSALKASLDRLIEDYGYQNSIRLEENATGIIIHILDNVLFPSGSANFTKGSEIILDHLANLLKKLPNDIRIEGHTDNVPIHTAAFPSNWHLSVARALNTAYYLINNEGLAPNKISIVGYSEYKPIASNDTEAGRATNRRVDIVIIKK